VPISPYLNGERFDPEDKRVLGVAFEMVCIALRIGDSDDGVKQAIATKIIDLAKAGERNQARQRETRRFKPKVGTGRVSLVSGRI
jgi:hypothetical protein